MWAWASHFPLSTFLHLQKERVGWDGCLGPWALQYPKNLDFIWLRHCFQERNLITAYVCGESILRMWLSEVTLTASLWDGRLAITWQNISPRLASLASLFTWGSDPHISQFMSYRSFDPKGSVVFLHHLLIDPLWNGLTQQLSKGCECQLSQRQSNKFKCNVMIMLQ